MSITNKIKQFISLKETLLVILSIIVMVISYDFYIGHESQIKQEERNKYFDESKYINFGNKLESLIKEQKEPQIPPLKEMDIYLNMYGIPTDGKSFVTNKLTLTDKKFNATIIYSLNESNQIEILITRDKIHKQIKI